MLFFRSPKIAIFFYRIPNTNLDGKAIPSQMVRKNSPGRIKRRDMGSRYYQNRSKGIGVGQGAPSVGHATQAQENDSMD